MTLSRTEPAGKPAAEPMISLADVALTLGSAAGPVNILRGIDLDVLPGEIVSVVGPSGAGKSTLMMVIGGLESPSEGVVRVAGQDIARLDEDRLARFRRGKVGIVFQAFRLIGTMTALENVAVPLELTGRTDAFAAAEAALGRVGLGHRLHHYPEQLSGGEQQRVAVARAFVTEPDLLLADEPTGNLDGETGEEVIQLLFGLARERGTTVLLVTHDLGLAERCDRTIRIVDGRLESPESPHHGPDTGAPSDDGRERSAA